MKVLSQAGPWPMTASLFLLLIHLLFLYKLFLPGWLLIWAAVSMNLLLLTAVYLGCVRHFLGYVTLPANNLRAFRNPKVQAACHNNYIQIFKSRNQTSVSLKTFQMISRCNQIWEPAAGLREQQNWRQTGERMRWSVRRMGLRMSAPHQLCYFGKSPHFSQTCFH